MGPTITSSSCARTRWSSSRSWPRCTTSRSQMPPRSPPSSCRSSRVSTSRSHSPAKAATSSSEGTTTTSVISSPRDSAGLLGWCGRLSNGLPSSSAKASTFDHKAKRFVRGARLTPLQRHYAWKEVFSPEGRTDLFREDRRGELDPAAAASAAATRKATDRMSCRASWTSTSASSSSTTCS